MLLSLPPPLIRILSLSFPHLPFSTCESEEKRSRKRQGEEEKKERTNSGKMKNVPHGASSGALWNAVSEGRMKALVMSHHANRRTQTHIHTHNLVRQRRIVSQRRALKRRKCKENEKRQMKNKQEEATVLGFFILTHICPDA